MSTKQTYTLAEVLAAQARGSIFHLTPEAAPSYLAIFLGDVTYENGIYSVNVIARTSGVLGMISGGIETKVTCYCTVPQE
jgi:hypothetical protein